MRAVLTMSVVMKVLSPRGEGSGGRRGLCAVARQPAFRLQHVSTITISSLRNMANAIVTPSLGFTFHISSSATVIDFQRHFVQVGCGTVRRKRTSTENEADT